jgi:hypothetical protein
MVLNDNTIGHIAKLIQMALITGTDIVDHLRMMQLEVSSNNDGSLVLQEEYSALHDKSINEMIAALKPAEEE